MVYAHVFFARLRNHPVLGQKSLVTDIDVKSHGLNKGDWRQTLTDVDGQGLMDNIRTDSQMNKRTSQLIDSTSQEAG